MNRTLNDKILVLGVDGMDPRLAKHFMDKGSMPNLQKYVEMGAARDDLMLLGAHPTVTPPMWTTLATGAYPMTHGITDYHMQSKESLDTIYYAFDSRLCKAEQLWNVFAEAGKKTLVFHWPGSSWPPTSDSPNLHVVDGLTPGAIGMAGGIVDTECICVANESLSKITFLANVKLNAIGAGCIIEGLDIGSDINDLDATQANIVTNIMLGHMDGDAAVEEIQLDFANAPIRPAEGWAHAPQEAKEFVLLQNGGLVRRPVLLLKNEAGIYDHIEIYEKKDQAKCLCAMKVGDFTTFVDKAYRGGEECQVNRTIGFMQCAEDGSDVKIYLARGVDIAYNSNFHPLSLFDQIVQAAGYVPAMPTIGGMRADLLEQGMLPCWEHYTKWQNKAMKALIDENQYDVIFSHIHNVDICAHVFYRLSIYRKHDPEVEIERYPGFMERLYVDVDRYLGEFMEYLDKGYTIFIVSDHGGVIPTVELPPLIGDPLGVNAKMLYDLGYTGLKKDAEGNLLKEIDWATTRAIATRECYIWINLKGRDKTGIVDPKDKYFLEQQIIDDLYNYRDPDNGERVISLALRRKDAVHFGLDSDECGDIIYFVDEGHNHCHGDGLSTVQGPLHTSVSPIFVACGKGIKQGYKAERVIRQVDFAPTLAALAGVRMPRECEGAPAYQIFDGDVVMQ